MYLDKCEDNFHWAFQEWVHQRFGSQEIAHIGGLRRSQGFSLSSTSLYVEISRKLDHLTIW